MQIMKTIRPSFSTTKLGLCVSISQPWLAGSLDGAVTDPSEKEEGLQEIKCPFQCAQRQLSGNVHEKAVSVYVSRRAG